MWKASLLMPCRNVGTCWTRDRSNPFRVFWLSCRIRISGEPGDQSLKTLRENVRLFDLVVLRQHLLAQKCIVSFEKGDVPVGNVQDREAVIGVEAQLFGQRAEPAPVGSHHGQRSLGIEMSHRTHIKRNGRI